MSLAARRIERPRERARIGADRARSWVRDVSLRNPYAKSILMAVANYMNEDGAAWPGLATLARDTDISEDTIAARLRWCESIGLIVVLKCWVDENGRRNYEKTGRPTSSEIRFQFDADIEAVEAAAWASKGDPVLRGAAAKAHTARDTAPDSVDDAENALSDSGDSEICHRPRRGLTDHALPPVSTQVAPDQPPPPAVRSLEQEVEEDSPPYPPPGGDGQQSGNLDSDDHNWQHAESWQRLKAAWGDPISSPDICKRLWSAFTEAERERCLRVVRGYLAWRHKQPKLPMRMNLQKLLRARDSWPEYAELAGPDPALRTFIVENSPEHRALQVIAQIGGWVAPLMQFDRQHGTRGLWRPRPMRPDEFVMGQFDKPVEQWTALERGTQPFYAWSDRLFDWTGQRRESIRVPILFPPRKDGSVPSSTDPPEAPD
jgi:hypothetical protein